MIVYWFGLIAAAYGGFVLLLYFTQSQMVFFPGTGREIIAAPDRIGLSYDDISLETADGLSLHAWFVPADKPRGAVLFMHGNAGNISHRLDSLQMFHRLGYSTLIFDYRGYGKSDGKPTEQGTYRDAEAAWQYLTSERRFPPCRIILFGESMGGAVAAWLAAQKTPAALVIASGFTSVPDLAQDLYPFIPARRLARIHFNTREHLLRVNAPVLIAHSPEDDIVPYRHGLALYAASNSPRQFLELAGGHNDGFIFMREAWIATLDDFLDRYAGSACMN